MVLIEADDLGAAGRVCATGLAGARDAGDLWTQGSLLEKMVVLDLNAGRYEDAGAHLSEGLHITLRSGLRANALDYLDCWKRAGTADPFRPRNRNHPVSGTEERCCSLMARFEAIGFRLPRYV